jgi:hypothetical protein
MSSSKQQLFAHSHFMPFLDGAAYVICLVSSTTFDLDVELTGDLRSSWALADLQCPEVSCVSSSGFRNMWLDD